MLDKRKDGKKHREEKKWSGRAELNRRPHGPEPCALPGCATPRSISECDIQRAYHEGRSKKQSVFLQYKI